MAEELALVETKAHMNDPSITQPQQFRVESYVKLMRENSDVFALSADGKIAAVCVILTCKDVNYPGYADIVEISVLPEMQNRLYAKRLISYALAEMRIKGFSFAYARCLCSADDSFEERIRSFFKGLGFKVRQSDPDHDGVCEILFTKEL